MTNSVDPDPTAPIGAVCSGSTMFVSMLNPSVMLGSYLQQTTSADDIFRFICFLGALRVKTRLTKSLINCSERFHSVRLCSVSLLIFCMLGPVHAFVVVC